MKSKLIILGCGSSLGVPSIDGFWGNCDKNNKKNYRSRCSAIIIKGSNSILIDTSPDIRKQLLSNQLLLINQDYLHNLPKRYYNINLPLVKYYHSLSQIMIKPKTY